MSHDAQASEPQPSTHFPIVETSINSLLTAISSRSTSSVELVSLYLNRIAKYDSHANGPLLNSIPILNPNVFNEAAASDARRASGLPPRPLEGIPYTVKDSYKVAGLTVASGSPAFKDLIANEDAFTVQRLRDAGAILIGKTNMPPMAAGGMQRGVYGRAESPYNAEYLTAAFASGSSNGSATSTAASFAAFGMAEETVSSGRSPASNNGLVCYTPSRGVISIRGNWPLYPTCDVVVPHTRCVEDMLVVLDVIVAEDPIKHDDFWREQMTVQLPSVESVRPRSYVELMAEGAGSLKGKRIGVPRTYIGQDEEGSKHVYTRQSVIDLWNIARKDLESLGAEVIETSFPMLSNFEREDYPGQTVNVPGMPSNWPSVERSQLIAYAWDDFLVANKDPNYPTLGHVNPFDIFPRPPASLVDKYNEVGNAVKYHEMANYCTPNRSSIFDLPDLPAALLALELARQRDFEDWLTTQNLDCLVFPANGDVGRADADKEPESAKHAWLNGVKYSNGNRALRHLGVPTVSVCMGIMEDTHMPLNLTFAGRAYDDSNLLRFAAGYEGVSKRRRAPRRTPEVQDVEIKDWKSANRAADEVLSELQIQSDSKRQTNSVVVDDASSLTIEKSLSRIKGTIIELCGTVEEGVSLKVYVDGEQVKNTHIMEDGSWTAIGDIVPLDPKLKIENGGTVVVSQTMVVAVARGRNSRTTGLLLMLDPDT